MSINILGSIVAAVVSVGIGFAWYSEALFGRQWREEMEKSTDSTSEKKRGGMIKMIVGGFLAELVMAVILSFFIAITGVPNIVQALVLAFWLWLGFVATIMSAQVIYERKSWKLYSINAFYRLVGLLVMALLLMIV